MFLCAGLPQMPPLFPPILKRDLTGTITLENCQFDIKSNSHLPYDLAIPFLRYLLKANEDICPPKDWYKNIPQFSSVTQSCPTLCNPMDCSTPGLPVHHQLPEFTQTHVH